MAYDESLASNLMQREVRLTAFVIKHAQAIDLVPQASRNRLIVIRTYSKKDNEAMAACTCLRSFDGAACLRDSLQKSSHLSFLVKS